MHTQPDVFMFFALIGCPKNDQPFAHVCRKPARVVVNDVAPGPNQEEEIRT